MCVCVRGWGGLHQSVSDPHLFSYVTPREAESDTTRNPGAQKATVAPPVCQNASTKSRKQQRRTAEGEKTKVKTKAIRRKVNTRRLLQNTHKEADRNVAYVCSGASWRHLVPELHRSNPATRPPRRDGGQRVFDRICVPKALANGRVRDAARARSWQGGRGLVRGTEIFFDRNVRSKKK